MKAPLSHDFETSKGSPREILECFALTCYPECHIEADAEFIFIDFDIKKVLTDHDSQQIVVEVQR